MAEQESKEKVGGLCVVVSRAARVSASIRFDEEDVVEFQVDADPSEPSREQQKLARSAHRLE